MIANKKVQKNGFLSKFLIAGTMISLLGGAFLLSANANDTPNSISIDGIKNTNLEKRFSTVHFSVLGQDFGGGFFWNEAESLATPQTIFVDDKEELRCNSKIRGYYYNSQRGERLWPLDEASRAELSAINTTYKQENLGIEGGLYTNCTKYNRETGIPIRKTKENDLLGDIHAIYGRIIHTYVGKTYTLSAGLKNDTSANSLPQAEFRCNLQRIDNQYPFGYIYDSHGGIALVGAYIPAQKMKETPDKVQEFHSKFTSKLDKNNCINNFYELNEENGTPKRTNPNLDIPDNILTFGLGDAINTMMNLGIRGIVGLSKQIQTSDQQSIQNNTTKTSLLVSTESNISNIINAAKKRAETLCRNRWTNGNSGIKNGLNCLTNTKQLEFTNNIDKTKTIIIKNGNLTLKNYMQFKDDPINILLMNGDLYLPNIADYQNFKTNGYPGGTNDKVGANYLKGNFIINGLIQGIDPTTNMETGIEKKLIVHGKIASLNTLNIPQNETKKKIVQNILKREISEDKLNNLKIGLSEIFTRKCNLQTGIDADGYRCTKAIETTNNSENPSNKLSENPSNKLTDTTNFILDKAFGLIDIYYPSPLFR